MPAVESLMTETDPDILARLKTIRSMENDDDVIDAIDAVLAYADLDNEDPEIQLAAIQKLDKNLNQGVLLRLKELEQNSAQTSIRKAAAGAVSKIEYRVSFFGYLETLFFGLGLGSILALAAVGLSWASLTWRMES